jgi:aspartyl-tRNA(Asn)/glutamyl-tRNA(Gln) amidotransferase subunit B
MPVRRKENSNDYRYFPDPDLPVFIPDAAFLKSVDDAIPELPLPRAKRIADEYGLMPEQVDLICEEKALADYFESTVTGVASLSKKDAATRVANWLLQDIKHVMGREGVDPEKIGTFRLTPRRFAGLIAMTAGGKITGKNARQTLEAVIAEDKDPEEIVRERGWEIISDPAEIAKAVQTVAEAEAATVTEAKAADLKRRKTLTAFLIGKVLAATGGRADPKIVGEQIEGLLGGE